MQRNAWQTLFQVGREVSAAATSLANNKLVSMQKQQGGAAPHRGTMLVAGGFGSFWELYATLETYYTWHGYRVQRVRSLSSTHHPDLAQRIDAHLQLGGWGTKGIARWLASLDLNIPYIPTAIDAFVAEVTETSQKYGGPLALVGHSLGGIVIAAAMTRVGHLVDRAVLFGSPFDATTVFPFLVKAVCGLCEVSLDPLSRELEPIIDFIEQPDPTLRAKMLVVTVPGDNVAPPHAGGLPGVIMASRTPRGRANTHAGMIADRATLRMGRYFLELGNHNPADVPRLLEERCRRAVISTRSLAELPNLGRYYQRGFRVA